ncbi:hypothetical protein A0H81_08262 [Grifola frondosa]|uniref:Uncharacterized protein n=1 Tax=Grifola frondosa TaxID=5627 RepID=A0A1C7M4J7_GRIFR|nr:hypothetical protein A0H81_08262 [Grifola frondosa]
MESYEEPTDLSYDDTVPYSEQLPSPSSERYESDRSLAHRIGGTKVYLLSETTGARVGKRKHDEEEYEEAMDEDVDMVEGDSRFRDNAILVHGAPISHLPTSNIFAYATNFDAHPMGLEWIDDTTCILVFTSKSVARAAYNHLAKSATEAPSPDDDSVAAKTHPHGVLAAGGQD